MSQNSETPAETGNPGSSLEQRLDEFGSTIENDEILLEIMNDQDIFERELDRIFSEAWIFVGHESEIPEEGDYRRRYIGHDPFIFVRDENGEIQVLFDSCRHRGATVCRAEKGNTTHFRCPYHGWTYRNTGELVGVPQKGDGFPELDQEEHGLHSAIEVDSYNGLVFASLSKDAPSLEEYLGPAKWYLDLYFKFIDMEVIGDPHRWEIDINWKTGADNMSGDNYHIPMGHKSAIDVGVGSETAKGEKESILYAIAGNGGHGFSIYQVPDEDFYWGHPPEVVETFNPDAVTDEQQKVARQSGVSLGNIFPNLSFIHLGGSNDPEKSSVGTFILRLWHPVGPNETEVWNWVMAPKDASEEYKERVYETGMGLFGPGGNFDVDDIAIWNGITDSAKGNFASKVDATTIYSMGRGEETAATATNEWPGPGEAYENGGMIDENQLDLYRKWYDMIQ